MSVFNTILNVKVFTPVNGETMPLYYNIDNGNGYYYSHVDYADGETYNYCPVCAMDCMNLKGTSPMECHEVSDDANRVYCDNCPDTIETGKENRYYVNGSELQEFQIPCDGSGAIYLWVLTGDPFDPETELVRTNYVY